MLLIIELPPSFDCKYLNVRKLIPDPSMNPFTFSFVAAARFTINPVISFGFTFSPS